MEEPNLKQIEEIAGGDTEFVEEILAVMQREFPLEKKHYRDCVENRDLIKTAEIVHKLKHKISILGLEKGYLVAKDYENSLRDGQTARQKEFEELMLSIDTFLVKLKK